jgi:hypothetical protein
MSYKRARNEHTPPFITPKEMFYEDFEASLKKVSHDFNNADMF